MSNPNDNQMQDDLQFIMGDHRGRRFIAQLLDLCGVRGHALVTGFPDATGFNLGQQNIGRQIEQMCDIDQFYTMTKEAKERADDRPDDSNDRNPVNDGGDNS